MDRTTIMSRSQTNIPMPALMPKAVNAPMPSVSGISGLGDTGTGLTPTTVVQRLPSIVNPTPVDLGATCDPFTTWVSANPGMALIGLAAIAYFTIFKGGK